MITIYPAELDIADAIKNNSIAFNLTPEIVDHELDFTAVAGANPFQIDLFYLKSILVSLGWNANDDVFDKREVLNARHTPVDKQFNFMHNEKDIIGHITSAKIYDGKEYIDGNFETLPDKFDIIVGSVIYKKWSDEKLQERMNKLIAEIKDNLWFVSMECLFPNFDYALLSPDGTNKVIARNKDTAFLTKYLRVYGGVGEFKGEKIGRLLRDFSFSGKGLVTNPANKRSVILDYSDISEDLTSAKTKANKETVMADYTEKEYKDLESRLAKAEQAAKDSADKDNAKQMDALKAQITQLTTEKAELAKTVEKLAEAEKTISVAQEASKNKDAQLATLKAEKEALDAKITAQDKILAEAALAKTKADRLTKLANKEITAEKAQALVDKFITVAPEMFDELVNSLADKKTDKKDEKKAEAKVKVDPVLDDYGLDADPTLAVANVDTEKNDQVRASASSWVKSTFNNKANKSKADNKGDK